MKFVAFSVSSLDILMSDEERQKWVQYLTPEQTPTYGTYDERLPEYREVYGTLFLELGIEENDFILDFGAGSADMDRYMRESTTIGSFKYLPIDGSSFGRDFNDPGFWAWADETFPKAEYVVSIETIEHLYDYRPLFNFIDNKATKGAVITTPNAAAGFDVHAQDPTHYSALTATVFMRYGYEVRQHSFTGRSKVRGEEDALIAWKKFNNDV